MRRINALKFYRQRRPTDTHVHFRDILAVMQSLLALCAEQFGMAFAQPNTQDPILSATRLRKYGRNLTRLSPKGFVVRGLIQITERTTAKMVYAAKEAGAVAGKVYPWKVTNNSNNGVRDYYHALEEPLTAAQKVRLPIQFHGETPCHEQASTPLIQKLGVLGTFKGINPDNFASMDRSRVFVNTIFRDIVTSFPLLHVSLEHISTAEEVNFINHAPDNVAGAIAPHYLFLSQDDLLGGQLVPAINCKPSYKTAQDVAALLAAAMSGNPQFHLGSDTAFHDVHNKMKYDGCAAGNFTAKVLMPVLVQLFAAYGKLDLLENLTAVNFAHHYGLEPCEGQIELERKPLVVPKTLKVGDLEGVPWLAEKTLDWSVVR